jgi:hypothetical protein
MVTNASQQCRKIHLALNTKWEKIEKGTRKKEKGKRKKEEEWVEQKWEQTMISPTKQKTMPQNGFGEAEFQKIRVSLGKWCKSNTIASIVTSTSCQHPQCRHWAQGALELAPDDQV